jgi:hypothetical protein
MSLNQLYISEFFFSKVFPLQIYVNRTNIGPLRRTFKKFGYIHCADCTVDCLKPVEYNMPQAKKCYGNIGQP